jgi:acyl-CoA dehydrogenase
MTIARDRWQQHLKTRGQYYHDLAIQLEELHARQPDVGAEVAALATHALAELFEACRVARLTRSQHVLLRLGQLAALAEGAGALCRRAAQSAGGGLPAKASHRFDAAALGAMGRVNARNVAIAVTTEAVRWVIGAGGDGDAGALAARIRLPQIQAAQAGLMADLDAVATAVYRG